MLVRREMLMKEKVNQVKSGSSLRNCQSRDLHNRGFELILERLVKEI